MPLSEATIEHLAHACHELNRHYCRVMGDYTQVPWHEAPEWQRDSARDGVRFVAENPDAGESGNHDNWLVQKQREGWVYGPVKDPANKEHPCMVAYEALPLEQRFKDRLFRGIVLTALNTPKSEV